MGAVPIRGRNLGRRSACNRVFSRAVRRAGGELPSWPRCLMLDWLATVKRHRARKLENAGQLALDLRPETPSRVRLAEARQLPLELQPGVELERRYTARGRSLRPGRLVVAIRKGRAVLPVSFLGTPPGSVLARLRRGGGQRELLASRWWPRGYFSVWFRAGQGCICGTPM